MLGLLHHALQACHPPEGQKQRSVGSAWSCCWVLHMLRDDR